MSGGGSSQEKKVVTELSARFVSNLFSLYTVRMVLF